MRSSNFQKIIICVQDISRLYSEDIWVTFNWRPTTYRKKGVNGYWEEFLFIEDLSAYLQPLEVLFFHIVPACKRF